MTLANIISLVRIGLIPVFLYFFFSDVSYSRLWVALVFVATGMTDALDGYLARSRNEVSRLGTLLDPLADKLMMAAAFIALTIAGKVPLWLPIVLIGKEVALIIGAAFFYVSRAEVVSASVFGKSATVILYIGVTMALLDLPGSDWLINLGVAVSLVAGLDYARRALLRRNP